MGFEYIAEIGTDAQYVKLANQGSDPAAVQEQSPHAAQAITRVFYTATSHTVALGAQATAALDLSGVDLATAMIYAYFESAGAATLTLTAQFSIDGLSLKAPASPGVTYFSTVAKPASGEAAIVPLDTPASGTFNYGHTMTGLVTIATADATDVELVLVAQGK